MQQAVQTTKISRTLDLAYMALGAVVIAVCSWISIPAAVPFTMQTFAVFFVLLFLGGRRGTGSILVYVLLGAVGMPVFAQFTSGLGVLLGSTGGYIAGFILTGLIYWLVTEVFGRRLWVKIAALVLGWRFSMPSGQPGFCLSMPGQPARWESQRRLAGASSPLSFPI